MINFWTSVFPLPKKCLDALEKMCSGYLWKSIPSSARGAKVSWSSVCTPKKCGGLGLKRLKAWNQVFTLKLIWLLFTKSGSLWVSWVHKVLIKGRLFWDISPQSAGSWLWRRILKIRALARPLLFTVLGSGLQALFWHDDWTNLGPLIDITGPAGPMVTGVSNMAVVAQVVHNGVWVVPQGRSPLCALLRACLPTVPTLVDTSIDHYQWRNSINTSPGMFSSSLTWERLHPLGTLISWKSAVWFVNHIPKHAFFALDCYERQTSHKRSHYQLGLNNRSRLLVVHRK
ncbi:unnamed protein product [Arabis nemorensis]|uniref:Reverse transcriptase zinc-binding domain-containing protein n=1 Tax=Arabis nemorensis TaxID=586526 RepID=A0A565B2U9_9BRAS|nr:unnamed protein product [Arabis nemorensis]